jgi:SOS-response transcriptional repressor LexA
MKPLTARQAEGLQVIREYFEEFDCFPTLRAIIPRMGFSEGSTNSAQHLLKALESKGYLERWEDGTGATGWRFTRAL